ncbi:MAG: TylF/MycF/NovP-related O-methyltransferase [Aquihabitans sp.]
MADDRQDDTTLMVEWNRQTAGNLHAMDAYEELFATTPGSVLSKLENFAKHVRRQRLSKFLAHSEIFRQQLDVHGSVLDLGVNAGQSLFSWAQLSAILEPVNYTRTIIGFDTFAGIPDVTAEDTTGSAPSANLAKGAFAFDDIDSLHQACAAFDANRFLGHIPKVELVKGDILQTLPAYLEDNQHLVVSLLHLDMDVFEPTKLALQLVTPRMPKGAIIVFDQVNQRPYPGETRAVMDSLGVSALRLQRFPWETGLSYAVLA